MEKSYDKLKALSPAETYRKELIIGIYDGRQPSDSIHPLPITRRSIDDVS